MNTLSTIYRVKHTVVFAFVMFLMLATLSTLADESGDSRSQYPQIDEECHSAGYQARDIEYKILECRKTINTIEIRIFSLEQEILFEKDEYVIWSIEIDIGLLRCEIRGEEAKIAFLEEKLLEIPEDQIVLDIIVMSNELRHNVKFHAYYTSGAKSLEGYEVFVDEKRIGELNEDGILHTSVKRGEHTAWLTKDIICMQSFMVE